MIFIKTNRLLIVLIILFASCIVISASSATDVQSVDLDDAGSLSVINENSLDDLDDSMVITSISSDDNVGDLESISNDVSKSEINVSDDITALKNRYAVIVYNETELINSMNNSNVSIIKLGSDISINHYIETNLSGLIIDGQGHKISPGENFDFNHICAAFTFFEDNCSIVNCTFMDFSSIEYGGAIYLVGDNCSIVNCTFKNSKSEYGGAIYLVGDNCSIVNCTFNNNTGTVKGGSIFFSGVNGFIKNCTFRNNIANMQAPDIYWNGANGFIRNCAFINSNVVGLADCAGSILLSDTNTSVVNCIFKNISIPSISGTIYCMNHTGFIKNCIFINCTVKYGSGIFCSQSSNTSILDCNFLNSSTFQGGAIFVSSINKINILNCTFININSSDNGGAVYFCERGNGSIINCIFTNCSSKNCGGSLYLSRAYCDIINCSFLNLNAFNGGAIFWFYNNGSIVNCTFTNINASYSYGAIYLLHVNSPIINCTFINVSSADYGAVYGYYYDDCLFIINSTFLNAYDWNNKTLYLDYGAFNLIGNDLINGLIYNHGDILTPTKFVFDSQTVKSGTIIDIIGTLYDSNGKNGKHNIILNDKYSEVSIILNNNCYDASINDKYQYLSSNIDTDGFSEDTYPIKSNLSSKNYPNLSYEGNLIISRPFPTIRVNISSENGLNIVYKDTVRVVATLDETNATGVLSFSLNNVTWTNINIINSSAKLNFSGLNSGTHILFIKYSGDENYHDLSLQCSFDISKINTTIIINDIIGEEGSKVNLTVKVFDQRGNPITEGIVIINIGGKIYKTHVKDGISIIEIVIPSNGNYSATIYFDGNDTNYEDSFALFNITSIARPNPSPKHDVLGYERNVGVNTGNPLFVLLIALITLTIGLFKRKF